MFSTFRAWGEASGRLHAQLHLANSTSSPPSLRAFTSEHELLLNTRFAPKSRGNSGLSINCCQISTIKRARPEIERVFLSHKDVIEAVAVKTYSKKWGETPTVLVVTNSHDKFIKIYEDLVKLSRKKLAGYKQPSFIKYFSKENIPRSSTGKVQRHLIEKMIDSNFKG